MSYESISTGSSAATVYGTPYTINWTVTSNTFPTYKLINVSVSWTDRTGGAQSVQVSSNIAGIEPAFSAIIY